jgi:hypothetical protein
MTEPAPTIAAPATVRRTEVRSGMENPSGNLAPLEGLRMVILWTISDVFSLVSEEILWLRLQLDDILAPLIGVEPVSVPASVRHEMLEGFYSRELRIIEGRNQRNYTRFFDHDATRATASDWAAVTMQMIAECYAPAPRVHVEMHAKIIRALRELGVDNPSSPRPARYLPNDIRYRLNHAMP